jgi:hypothetical protein
MQKIVQQTEKHMLLVSTLAYEYKVQLWDEATGEILEEKKFHIKRERAEFDAYYKEMKQKFTQLK